MSSECIDIDKLGTLSLEHFEHDDLRFFGRNTTMPSTTPSPTPSCYFSEENESPIPSPNEPLSPPIHSPLSTSSGNSSSGCSFSSSDDDLTAGEMAYPHKKRTSEGRYRGPSISKRNERERKRVKLISEGFSSLRKHVHGGPANRKAPKLQTLRNAIDYIKALQEMLDESDRQMEIDNHRTPGSRYAVQPVETQNSLEQYQGIVKPGHTMRNQCYHNHHHHQPTSYEPPFQQQLYHYQSTTAAHATQMNEQMPWFLEGTYTQ